MAWIPPDLSEACAVYTTITTCQPSTFLFLQLVANLFGQSKDKKTYFSASPSHNKFNTGFNTFFTNTRFSGFDNGHINQPDNLGFDNGHISQAGFDQGHDSGEFDHDHSSPGDTGNEEFDFIVVGAGSAGCVVANRLTEEKHWRVLLLEAGGEEPEVADVPAFAPTLQRSSIDWAYYTQPSPRSCLARQDGRCYWGRGKVMGGSSTINYMIYIRGNPADYDEWEQLGNKGWSYRDVLPYFIKSEDNRNPEKINSQYHGVGGYQTVEFFPYQDEPTLALIKGYEELGLKYMDQNAQHQIGTMLLQHTSRDGERLTTNGAFIRPIRYKRENLIVRPLSQVHRILIDQKSKTAFGVEYSHDGKLLQAIAKKEVIVSAGSIDSPKLLMLSGIGPANELLENGIHVIKDLAVGFNLQDHTTIDGVVFALNNHSATSVSDEQRKSDVFYFRNTHQGPLSSTGPLQANAFVQTKYEQSLERPDIQFSMDAVNVDNFFTDPVLTAATNALPLSYYTGMTVRPILLSPHSRGVVRLNQSDPVNGAPLIHANTFFEEIDLLRMVEGVKQALNLLRTHAMNNIGARLVTTPLPNCQHLQFGTDQYWACVAMSYTTTIFHPVGTCKMGPKSDRYAVVDPYLRVHGIHNLRVIDASIMPKIVRGNTNAPTLMIAEKGSDLIKAQWKGHHSGETSEVGYENGKISGHSAENSFSTPNNFDIEFANFFNKKDF